MVVSCWFSGCDCWWGGFGWWCCYWWVMLLVVVDMIVAWIHKNNKTDNCHESSQIQIKPMELL